EGERLQLELPTVAARERAWSTVGERCLQMTTERRAAAIAGLERALEVSLPPVPTAGYKAMTWDEAARLDPALIEFGSHTCTHPVLSRCNPSELAHELCEARRVMKMRLP